MKLKKVNERPVSGQFVSVWEYNGVLWSGTFLWMDGTLKQYDPNDDHWFTADAGEQDKEYYVKAD